MEPQSKVATSTARYQHASCWYRAATLGERLVSCHVPGTTLDEGCGNEEAEKMLERWKTQEPFDKSSLFADRLAMGAMTERDLLALLAESPETLQKRLASPAPPDWINELMQTLHADPFPPVEPGLEHVFLNATSLRPFYPLLHKSILYLQKGIEALAREYHALPFDPANILALLLPNVFPPLQLQVNKTLVLELNIARLRGQLRGETPEARFQDYLDKLSHREHLRSLLEEYPVLARQVLLAGQLWARCSLEFLQRLSADWPEIGQTFAPEQEPGELTRVAGGTGDTHRGGHSVMILTFRSGWQLVYKPKSLTVDSHFQEALAWLNERGACPAFRLLKLIDKTTYGWSEWIAVSDCSSEEEVARFYERQGGYLALLYALDATDLHYDNIIAAGEHPVIIDLEALFHPRNIEAEKDTRLAHQALEHSVLRSMLLPRRVLLNGEGEGVEIGGLGRRIEGQLSPHPVPRWDGTGTDEMKLIWKRVELAGGNNCPHLNGLQVEPLNYIEDLIQGFTNTYRLLMTEQAELLRSVLPRFAHDEIRFVARSTHTYTVLLRESFHPNLLRDALNRERFFDRLWLGVEHQPSLTRLIPTERADLLCGDIPLFITQPASLDLWTSQGECLPAFFARSSLELVSEHIQRFSETDLQRQIWFIRAAFVGVTGQRKSTACATSVGLLSSARTPSVSLRERLLMEARAIGDRLCDMALRDERHADWLGVTWIMKRDWQVAAAGLDLYGGLPGILLFLSYLGWLTGETRYTDVARAGLNTVRVVIQQNQALLDRGGISAFTGLGSCLYLFTHLAVLWHDEGFLQEAEELLRMLPTQIEQDKRFDLVDGTAGCLAVLLSFYTLAPSAYPLQVAMRCGDHLLAHAQHQPEGLVWKTQQGEIPAPGFAHGIAGIAWSLLRLATVSGEERFRDAALNALAYERNLFFPQQRDRLDPRKQPGRASSQDEQEKAFVQEQVARYGMSWSYGVPGIVPALLGLLTSHTYPDDAAIRTELEVAIEIMITNGFSNPYEQVGSNHSLALGDCGIIEILLLAAQTMQSDQLRDHLYRLTNRLLENMQQDGRVMGVPLNVETPGLLLGLAGIGYQCLRLAEPDRIPSVLTLTPPTFSFEEAPS